MKYGIVKYEFVKCGIEQRETERKTSKSKAGARERMPFFLDFSLWDLKAKMAKPTASPSSPAAPVKVTSLSFLGLDPSFFLSFPSFSIIFLSDFLSGEKKENWLWEWEGKAVSLAR